MESTNPKNQQIATVLRIRDVYPVSIPDPGTSKNISILRHKIAKKLFLSYKKYDPGYSSRIPDPDADFLPSRIPGSKRHPIPDLGSRIRIHNTGLQWAIWLIKVKRDSSRKCNKYSTYSCPRQILLDAVLQGPLKKSDMALGRPFSGKAPRSFRTENSSS